MSSRQDKVFLLLQAALADRPPETLEYSLRQARGRQAARGMPRASRPKAAAFHTGGGGGEGGGRSHCNCCQVMAFQSYMGFVPTSSCEQKQQR